MDQQLCPYLGTLDKQDNQQPGIEYPSFENHCFADRNFMDGTLLLGDQATYCLFGGCTHCPRFQDAQRFARPASSLFPAGFSPLPTLTYPKVPGPETIDFGFVDSEPLDPDQLAVDVPRVDYAFELTDHAVGSDDGYAVASSSAFTTSGFKRTGFDGTGFEGAGELGLDADWDDVGEFDDRRRFSPGWIIAMTLFLGVFMCGSVMAAFVSFQAVRSNLFASPTTAGFVNTVDPMQDGAQGLGGVEQLLREQQDAANPALYIVLTATPVGDAPDDQADAVAAVPVDDSAVENASIVDVGSGEVIAEAESVAEESADENVAVAEDESSELAIVAPSPTIDFPKAVTPTPIVVQLDNLDGAPQVNADDVSAPNDSDDDSDDDNEGANPRFIPAPTSTPVPEINVQIPVPTPPDQVPAPAAADQALAETVAEIAAQPDNEDASIEAIVEQVIEQVAAQEDEPNEDDLVEEATPEPTPTVTPTWPPPVVIFGAKDKALMAGECTELMWTVENVRAVYVENIAMNGSGDREECIRDKDETFVLSVVLPDGGTKIYTTTVALLRPTPTPTVTPTFTPIPIPTATWTPVPPPPTPTPAFIYGAALSAGGNTLSCAVGSSCEIGLTVTNIGNTTDNFTIFVERGGEWPPMLCRSDGVCAVDRLVVAGVGADNAGSLTLKLDIPEGTVPRNESYIFRASSDLSGGAARSESITIDVTVK